MSLRLDELPDVMSVPECAKFLGISRNGAYEAVRRAELPAIKVGRRLLVSKAALKQLLEGAERGGRT